jgi:hypothetical protein
MRLCLIVLVLPFEAKISGEAKAENELCTAEGFTCALRRSWAQLIRWKNSMQIKESV